MIFDIAVLAVGSVSAMLNVELYIPVLTEILGSFSLLDVICWVAGGAYTIMYKLLNQRAPFPDNDTTAQILEAKSISEVKLIIDNADSQSFPQQTGINGTRLMSYHDEWFDFLHGTGAFVTLVNAGVSAAEAEMPPGNPLGKVSGGLAIVSGGAIGLAGVLAPKYPTQNEVVKAINLTTTVLRVISKVTFATLGLDKVQVAGAFKFVKQNDCRSVSALVDAFLVIPGVACSAWHCYELSQNGHKDSKDFKLAVLEEVSNFSFYTGRIGYTIAVNDPEEVSKNIAIVGAVAANSMAAALQAAEVGVHDSLDSSKLPHSHKVGLAKPLVSGCDLVVATGTKKLSEELIRYFITLDDAEPVALVLCDKLGGYVPLQTVVDKTNINPFLLPADANYEDPQIRTLVDELGFKGGLQFTIGIPRIPEIRELNLFNNDGLYLPFKDICVINVDASTMTVDIYGQEIHEIWLASMGNPEFVSAALDSSLDTDFFNNNPDKKATVQKAINEMASGSFSLEQLLLNIPTIPVEECNAVSIDVPERVSSEVYTVIKAVVGALYSGEIKKHGQPVLSVQFKDTNSAFNLTDIKPRIHPDKEPRCASLDYYCGFNNHLIDDEFDMTSPWLEAGEEATLVLSRKALAEYYYDVILPYYQKMCISLKANVDIFPFAGARFSASFQDNQTPKSVDFPESGSVLWRMDYDDRSDDAAQAIDPISNMPHYGSMSLSTKSWCEVSIVGVTRVKVIQHLEIYFYMSDNGREAEGRVVDKTYEDVYDLGVDSEGKIKCQKSEADSHKTDNSERAHGFNNQDVSTVLAQIDPFISSLRTHDVTPYALEDMNKLVLPGADTFTYHHATFSEQQDLSCQLVFKK